MTCAVPDCTDAAVMTGVCSVHWLEAEYGALAGDLRGFHLEVLRARAEEQQRIREVMRTASREWLHKRWGREQSFGKTKYQRYLASHEWAITRALELHRAGYACEVCRQTQHLHVHHKTYARLGVEQPGDLIVLCSQCHAKVHDKEPRSPMTPRWEIDWSTRW